MCTAISFITKDHYFGRNLDLEYHYNEAVTITPKNYPFHFRRKPTIESHYSMIGIATVVNDYPLYYDATNEHGLSMAGLNFPGNAVYLPEESGKDNIAPFEFIPWILAQCKTVDEAKNLLTKVNLININFSNELPLSPLHWIICDKAVSIVVEPNADGIAVYDNPIGILTNNPPFPFHLQNLQNYMNLTREEPDNRFSDAIELKPYSRGMGAIGLPGDLSSASRFIRAAFTKLNSVCDTSESASISQFFHILGSVAQQSGCVKVNDGFERTIYTNCCNTDKGIYYYTTYENSQITAVSIHCEDLSNTKLTVYPLMMQQQIKKVNY